MMAVETPLSHIMGGEHAEIEIKDLEVQAENLLGGEGNGFSMGQHRLAYGQLRHGMHNVAMAQRALDLATKHITNRTTFGHKLAERQAVQFMPADCPNAGAHAGRLPANDERPFPPSQPPRNGAPASPCRCGHRAPGDQGRACVASLLKSGQLHPAGVQLRCPRPATGPSGKDL
jgi:Acyl-CoA dehydrogenase, C-terminal domain